MNTSKNSLPGLMPQKIAATLTAVVFVAGVCTGGVASAKEFKVTELIVANTALIVANTGLIGNVLDAQYVPFQAVTGTAEVCDNDGTDAFGDVDRFEIDSQATAGDFIVTSILFVAEAPGGGFIEIRNLAVDEVVTFVVNSGNLIDGVFGRSAFEALGESTQNGAFLPQQIAASSAGSPDIIVTLFCKATTVGMTFPAGQIVVSGWKQASDTITVTPVD